ncbi:MAG: hypothetical protein ACXAEU_26380 [Candidatus Hodarchaeales archaeon]|jgi:hypothetical protein
MADLKLKKNPDLTLTAFLPILTRHYGHNRVIGTKNKITINRGVLTVASLFLNQEEENTVLIARGDMKYLLLFYIILLFTGVLPGLVFYILFWRFGFRGYGEELLRLIKENADFIEIQ